MTSATYGRVFIKIDIDLKNHTKVGETKINLKRDTDNFDKKYVRPVNGIVINASNIPKGAEVLIHHNAVHDTYRVFDYEEMGAESISSTIKYFSVPETECYAWRTEDGEWQPAKGFEFGLRIFKPYSGFLDGMLPIQIKNKLYITSGEHKGTVVLTKAACDYEVIFQEKNGKEGRLIRLRHFKEPENIREEIVAVDNKTTQEVKTGELLIGLSPTDSSTIHNKVLQKQ